MPSTNDLPSANSILPYLLKCTERLCIEESNRLTSPIVTRNGFADVIAPYSLVDEILSAHRQLATALMLGFCNTLLQDYGAAGTHFSSARKPDPSAKDKGRYTTTAHCPIKHSSPERSCWRESTKMLSNMGRLYYPSRRSNSE